MTGLAYHRILQDLSCKELAEQVGCTKDSVRLYEKHLAPQKKGRSSLWLAFSDCLKVPVQELLKTDFPDLTDRKNGRTIRWSKTANPCNPITIYYRTHRLSYRELAERLGRTSRECARKACTAQRASQKHIKALTKYEGISEKAFLRKYAHNVDVLEIKEKEG